MNETDATACRSRPPEPTTWKPTWKRRSAYFGLGFLTTGLAFLWNALLIYTWFGFPENNAQESYLWPGLQVTIGLAPLIVGGVLLLVLRVRRGPRVRLLAYVFGATTPFWLSVGVLISIPRLEMESTGRVRFESAAWADPGLTGDPETRIKMVDDLIRRYDLCGMPPGSVEILLGPGDDTSYFSDWDLVYRLGMERSFIGIDSEWLVLRLDDERRVSEYEIVTD